MSPIFINPDMNDEKTRDAFNMACYNMAIASGESTEHYVYNIYVEQCSTCKFYNGKLLRWEDYIKQKKHSPPCTRGVKIAVKCPVEYIKEGHDYSVETPKEV